MEGLLADPGWRTLCSWVEDNVGQAAFKRLKAPSVSFDACIAAEYEKGTINGIELTLMAPANIVREMHAILAAQTDEDEEEDGRRTVDYDERTSDSQPVP